MRYKDRYLSGEFPERGAIFMSNTGTKKECLRRELFGLPSGNSDFVLHVKKGMTLFLFEFERRLLYGVYRATSDGEINIEPRAFRSSGKPFPAQVRFTTVWDCSPLLEYEFQEAIKDNYYSEKKFRFGLNNDQVSKLMKLFQYKKISKNHPEIYSAKPSERVSRFGSLRKDIRDRLRFVDKEDSRDLRKDITDRLRFVDEEDSLDLRISEFGDDEVKKVYDDVYSTKKMIEGSQKDDRDGFLTNYKIRNVDSGDYGSRQDTLGKHLDHLRFEEPRGTTNKDSLSLMDNIKSKHDTEDGYIPLFANPDEKHYGGLDVAYNDAKILMYSHDKDLLDYNRPLDEYNARETASVDGLHSPLLPDFVSERLSSSNAGLCKLEENATDNDKWPREPLKKKRRFGSDQRVSVFARLNSW